MGNGIGYPCCSSKEPHNSLFRSEEMTLCQLFLQSEAAYNVIAELGELGLLQFKDGQHLHRVKKSHSQNRRKLNPELNAFQRKFVSEVRLCDEMDRILRYMESELKKEGIKPAELDEIPEAPQPKEIRDINTELLKLESDLKDVNANRQQLKTNSLELKELEAVLIASATFLAEIFSPDEPVVTTYGGGSSNAGFSKNGLGMEDIELGEKQAEAQSGPASDNSMRLNFITGTIPAEKLNGFERMLWFACRGNVYLRYNEIEEMFEDPISGDPVRKAAFCLFFQGEKLKQKATKICEGFHCNIYTIPKTEQERAHMSAGLAERIADIIVVLEKTDDHRRRILLNSSESVRALGVKVYKTKSIYHTLNMFNMDVTQKCLIAECWAPVREMDRIEEAIETGRAKANSDVPSVINRLVANEKVPTFNRTNKFTKAFQSIVDAYGIGRYQEVNPALFTIVTFPFIFAIMFGDCAHGVVMFGFALWMVINEKKFLKDKGSNEIWNMIFGGRYIVLLMGFFSIYTGIVYNDFFSKSVNLFGSMWRVPFNNETADIHSMDAFYPLNKTHRVDAIYPIGIDPIWMIASNKITFINSYKMKMSIIIGVVQMLFGLCISFINHIFFRSWIGIFCEFIPEMIFILSIFGYMLVLIVVKWLIDFEIGGCAPSILVGFINMFLFSYENPPADCTQVILFPTFETQKFVQTILVACAGICLPWLLIAKPLTIGISRAIRNKKDYSPAAAAAQALLEEQGNGEAGIEAKGVAHIAQINDGNGQITAGNGMSPTDLEGASKDSAVDEEEEDAMGELIVHQCIHTIEYCLGCVSNTASYLRLWALSLAHAQLSEVLWNMVLKLGFTMNTNYLGAPMLFLLFAPFAVLTVAVLLMMEGLSAFLHALRLHWVEFNSKFFHGDGIRFQPFNFKHATDVRKVED